MDVTRIWSLNAIWAIEVSNIINRQNLLWQKRLPNSSFVQDEESKSPCNPSQVISRSFQALVISGGSREIGQSWELQSSLYPKRHYHFILQKTSPAHNGTPLVTKNCMFYLNIRGISLRMRPTWEFKSLTLNRIYCKAVIFRLEFNKSSTVTNQN